MIQSPLIIDPHLDLAYNASRGRDPRMSAKDQPIVENEIATVGLPDLRAGNVGLICATIFCNPAGYGPGGYTNAEEARAIARRQLDWYRGLIDQDHLRFVTRSTGILPVASNENGHGQDARATQPLSAILLMERADAMRSPDDVQEWFDAGLRICGLAWRKSRMAGGTDAPGPLSDDGRALVREFDRLGIIHDASHLDDQAFWQLLELSNGAMIASHSNCRAIVGSGNRHLSDEMIRALASRDGVIGINFYDQFLLPASEYGHRRATLADVIAHITHICDLTGSAQHVGLGTDMDGGLGREQIPGEIQTSADLPRVAEVLSSSGFSDEDIFAVTRDNWLRFFQHSLPKSS